MATLLFDDPFASKRNLRPVTLPSAQHVHQRKETAAAARVVVLAARVTVSFKKVPVMSKDAHKRLKEAARDPGKTSKRMFPVL